MKRFLFASALALMSTAAIAQAPMPTTAPASKPAPSDEFQRGWCAGWATAYNTSIMNFNGWLRFIQTVNPKIKTDKSPQGEATRTVMDSVPKAVLIGEQLGTVQLGDGTLIDCAAHKPGPTVTPTPPAK